MVDDRSTAEPLNHEGLLFTPTIIRNGDLNDTILNQEQSIRFCIFFTDDITLIICLSFHAEDELLFGWNTKIPEVGDLVHLNIEPHREFVIVLVYLSPEERSEHVKGLG